MADTVDITPSPRVLRMLGQIDFAPWQCLAELIDNSIDAFIEQAKAGVAPVAPRVKIVLPTDPQLRDGTGVLIIEDNGSGMSLASMKNAVRAGYSGNDPVEKMGLFGMGFNISTARLGRKTEVWTTTADSEEWIGIVIDFADLERNQTFNVPIKTKPKTDAELEVPTHGTKIQISLLEHDRTRPLMWGVGKANTKKKLGKIYGHVMSAMDITLSYDGDQIKPWKHCTWDASRTVPTKEFGHVPARLEINKTLSPRRFCTTCWVWLTDSDKSCISCGRIDSVIERKRSIKGWLGIQRYFDKKNFGIDLIRNGRVIEELDKTFFTFTDANGEEMLEYPIDAIHWGGRIVGELEIDFVRVTHQKDAFDKLDPEWKHVLEEVRGKSPMQPRIAQRMAFPPNTSPLATLFAGYRKGAAGLNDLVPGDSKGAGLNTGLVREYVERFYDGEADYQKDDKWYELVLQAEHAKRGGSSGAKKAGGAFPIDDDEEDEGETSEKKPGATEPPKSPEPVEDVEKDVELSRTYEIDYLPGSPTIAVSAFKHKETPTGKPFTIQPEGASFRFDYFVKADFFEESLETPIDCLATDLAHHFLALSGETVRAYPVSFIVRDIKKKYFPEKVTDISSSADAAEALLDDLRRHYDENLQSQAPIEVNKIDPYELEHIRKGALKAESATDKQIETKITAGEFARYVSTPFLIELVRRWPTVVTDDKFFSTPYSEVSVSLREDSLSTLIESLQDVRWLSEEGSSSVSKDAAWRLRYARSLASLRLVESWRN